MVDAAHEVPRSGATLEGVRLGELIGEGGAARVYAASDRRGRSLAVKVLRQTRSEDPAAHQRLMREASILATLSHPGLVKVLEARVAPSGHPYLVMERVSGASLKRRLEDGGPLPPREAWRITREAAEALAEAHAAGVLHRDLKPANLLLDGASVRVTDFGLALRGEDPRLTREGETSGTPAYMAPEQWWGAGVDARTDVYGLGAVLYETLCGRPPWHGEDPGQILHRMATSDPPSLTSQGADVPAVVEQFVGACLSREADGRPADLAAFVSRGDAAFGYHPPRRLAEPLVISAAVLGASVAVGYGGSHSPAHWIYEAGVGGYVLPVLAAVAALFMRRGAGRLVGPFLPLSAGALTTAASFQATLASVARAGPEERFEIFHLGLAESNSAIFMGAFLSAALAAWLAASDPRQERPRLYQVALSGVALVTATLAWDPVALTAGALASVLILRQAPQRGGGHMVASLGAALALCAAAWARHTGDTARLWASELTRGERASAVTSASLHDISLAGALVCVLLVLVVAGRWRSVRAVPRRTLLIMGTMSALTLAAMGAPWAMMRGQRQVLWDELAPRFSLWRELDPPRGAGTRSARVGPTLQLGRRNLAINGEVVAPAAALDGSGRTGPLLVAGKLGPLLRLDRSPQLVLTADRSLPWPRVSRALAAARELGVREVDLIFLPGPVPSLSPSAPPEASFVLPRDLRALTVKLVAAGDAVRPRAEETYGDVAGRLARMKTPQLISLWASAVPVTGPGHCPAFRTVTKSKRVFSVEAALARAVQLLRAKKGGHHVNVHARRRNRNVGHAHGGPGHRRPGHLQAQPRRRPHLPPRGPGRARAGGARLLHRALRHRGLGRAGGRDPDDRDPDDRHPRVGQQHRVRRRAGPLPAAGDRGAQREGALLAERVRPTT